MRVLWSGELARTVPWRFFPATQIDVVWFPEGREGERLTEKEFKGPLHKIIHFGAGN